MTHIGPGKPLRVAIVEDKTVYRQALQEYLDHYFFCPISVPSIEAFFEELNHTGPPDIILMDIGLPGMNGIEGMRSIKASYPKIEIIMLTVYQDSEKIFKSLCAGASGYLLKDTPLVEIKESINTLLNDGAPMTPQIARKVINHFASQKKPEPGACLSRREKEVVKGLVDGLSYKLIADRLGVSIHTVRDHIRRIYRKLHVNSKTEVITKSLRGEI